MMMCNKIVLQTVIKIKLETDRILWFFAVLFLFATHKSERDSEKDTSLSPFCLAWRLCYHFKSNYNNNRATNFRFFVVKSILSRLFSRPMKTNKQSTQRNTPPHSHKFHNFFFLDWWREYLTVLSEQFCYRQNDDLMHPQCESWTKFDCHSFQVIEWFSSETI